MQALPKDCHAIILVRMIQVTCDWKEKLQFEISNSSAQTALIDGNGATAISPMEALLGALCSCMATDVVMVLEKMRTPPASLKVVATGDRNLEPPRRYRRIELSFVVSGDLEKERVEHAVQLSFQTYCSVFHTLRRDIEITHSIEVSPAR